jgi:hypothetical protein
VRESKESPLTDKVDLIHANPNYAVIRYNSGREETVNINDISPAVDDIETTSNENTTATFPEQVNTQGDDALRRSSRVKKTPKKLDL